MSYCHLSTCCHARTSGQCDVCDFVMHRLTSLSAAHCPLYSHHSKFTDTVLAEINWHQLDGDTTLPLFAVRSRPLYKSGWSIVYWWLFRTSTRIGSTSTRHFDRQNYRCQHSSAISRPTCSSNKLVLAAAVGAMYHCTAPSWLVVSASALTTNVPTQHFRSSFYLWNARS